MNKKSAREMAYLALQDWMKDGTPVHQTLESLFVPGLSSIEKNLAKELSQGVVRRKLTLDEAVRQYSKISFPRLDVRVLNILRLAFYQLMFLDRIPAHAAVHEAVEMGKKILQDGSPPFINAILREFLRQDKAIRFPLEDELKSLSLEASYPLELIKRWVGLWGMEKTQDLCEAGNAKSFYTARVNLLKISRADLLARLNDKEEISEACAAHPSAIRLLNLAAALDSEAFRDGLFQVQDIVMLQAVDQMELSGAMTVLDICGAPGTKATAMAEKIPDGYIVCVDKAAGKFKQMEENLRRMGIENIRPLAADAVGVFRAFKAKFQRILVDVPCSNMGVLAKRPEARWHFSPGSLKRIIQLQFEILAASLKLLEKGGILVYSTCSIDPGENEEVVRRALKEDMGLKLVSESTVFPNEGFGGGYWAKICKEL
jgi:16S rRNA (cytosine967-C5)-methyltransferase